MTIDPASITDDAKSVDLNMDIILTSQATQVGNLKIPANSIAIIPNTHGSFGFDIAITFTAAQLTNARINGNNITLFYINENGKAVDMDKARLNDDGSIIIVINHASYYILSEGVPASYSLAYIDYYVSVFTRLNIRKAESTRSAIVGKLRCGDVVRVIRITDGWAQIAYTDEEPIAYISARYIRLKSN